MKGSRLALEENGTIICDDDVLEYFLKEKTVLMILDEKDEWLAGFLKTTLDSTQYLSDSSLNTTLSMTSGALSSCSENLEVPTYYFLILKFHGTKCHLILLKY